MKLPADSHLSEGMKELLRQQQEKLKQIEELKRRKEQLLKAKEAPIPVVNVENTEDQAVEV